MRRLKRFFLLIIILFPWAPQILSEVTEIEIVSRVPFAEGMKFGAIGAYEKIRGRLHYRVDPDNPANERIVDLKYAPRDADGNVHFSGDFILIKPVDLKKGNHRLLFDVPNRGNMVMLGVLNNATWSNDPTKAIHAGNGFLMKQGYSLLCSEWNWDVRPGNNRLQIDLPIATIDGKPITQRIAAEIVVSKKGSSKFEPITWGNSRCYPVANINDRRSCVLTVRDEPRGKKKVIPLDLWNFARLEGGRVIPDPTFIYLPQGYEPGKIYELIYTVKNPPIVGLGLAAVRDAISFFRFKTKDRHAHINPLAVSNGRNGNNLRPDPEKVYIFGISQSARFITHMIYQGFHVDEEGRMVFEGARIHMAGGGKGGFNHRFAQTTHVAGHLEGNYMPADFFPFNFASQEDPITHEHGDVLAIAKKMGKIPYIMITNNESEYWMRSASLIHTDVLGKKDASMHERVRIYFTCGAAHFTAKTRNRYIYEYSLNTLNPYSISRALQVALDRWVSNGIVPPPGNYPRIDRKELITPKEHKKQFPKIPGMRHSGKNLQPPRVNYGDKFWEEGIITITPPLMGKPYKTLVPNFDKDGNSIGGIRLPELQAPLGTYQGWNLRQAKYGAPGYLSRFDGSFWPFTQTEAERKKNKDPRPSIESRYPTRQIYVDKVSRAVDGLIKQGYMLNEDGKRYIEFAKKMVWPPKPIDSPPYWLLEGKDVKK